MEEMDAVMGINEVDVLRCIERSGGKCKIDDFITKTISPFNHCAGNNQHCPNCGPIIPFAHEYHFYIYLSQCNLLIPSPFPSHTRMKVGMELATRVYLCQFFVIFFPNKLQYVH